MYSNNYTLSGLTAEDSQSNVGYPVQGKDYWTMGADEFFAELAESNAKAVEAGWKNPAVIPPIEYDMVRKCRKVKRLAKWIRN